MQRVAIAREAIRQRLIFARRIADLVIGLAIGHLDLRGRAAFAAEAAFTAGWFRTGDEGMLDDDGYLFLTGRLKEQINRGGEKISPLEIDDVLLRHPAVGQAVAFAMAHPKLGEEVAAAVVLQDGAEASERELRAHVSRHLASFKVPRLVVFLDEIPRGATGKVQRIGLADKLGLV